MIATLHTPQSAVTAWQSMNEDISDTIASGWYGKWNMMVSTWKLSCLCVWLSIDLHPMQVYLRLDYFGVERMPQSHYLQFYLWCRSNIRVQHKIFCLFFSPRSGNTEERLLVIWKCVHLCQLFSVLTSISLLLSIASPSGVLLFQFTLVSLAVFHTVWVFCNYEVFVWSKTSL